MSLVGPRPLLVEYLERYTERQAKRHLVRPGITGLAQVNNGYDGSVDGARRKLKADLEYIQHRTWSTELRILFRTLSRFYDREAY